MRRDAERRVSTASLSTWNPCVLGWEYAKRGAHDDLIKMAKRVK
jgi:hypothetical protein